MTSDRWSVEKRIVSDFFGAFLIVITNSLLLGAFTLGVMLMKSSYDHCNTQFCKGYGCYNVTFLNTN